MSRRKEIPFKDLELKQGNQSGTRAKKHTEQQKTTLNS